MRYIDFSSVKETIGKIYFGICICVFAYAVIGVPILLGMLKKYGVKTEAVITPNTSSWVHRYTTNCYLYEFQVGDKTYDGNSLVEEGDYRKIGTRVQVLYLDWYPSFNRPTYYWDDSSLSVDYPQGSNKQTLMKYLCFIFCVLLVGACSSTKGSGKETLFCELDKEVQDSLLSVSRKVLEEDHAPQAMIDFSGNCKFTERNIGPWVVGIQIEDTVNKRSVSLPTNAPMPYIVHNNTVYYPEEYNLLVMGFDKNTKFRTIRMK